MGDGLTGPNWVTWQVRMMSLLALCEVEPYVRGEIKQPNRDDDPTCHINWKKKNNKEEMNMGEEVEEDEEEHITFSVQVNNSLDISQVEDGQYFNFDHDVTNYDEIDPRLIYYDWLGDCATTSHVCNRREAFKTFQPLTGTNVSGVGNVKAEAKGRGTVELKSSYEGHNYILQLESILYIPTNQNNLISLGRWDKSGRRYTGGGGELILIKKDGILLSRGTKIENNLYKMMVTTHKPDITSTKRVETQNKSFVIHEPVQSWETWHKRFGHISYSGLQHILDNNLVE